MYSTKTGLVLGFHGCDESIINDILLGKKEFKQSNNTYDWLGHGIYFWEGKEIYPDAGFKEKNHIQICIRNKNCIKGYFLPRELNSDYSKI